MKTGYVEQGIAHQGGYNYTHGFIGEILSSQHLFHGKKRKTGKAYVESFVVAIGE